MRSSSSAAPGGTFKLRTGGIVPIALAAVAFFGVFLISFNSYSGWLRSMKAVPAVSRPMMIPTAAQVEVGIRRAGLTPEAMAAAGLSGPEVTALVQASRGYLNEHLADLEAADNTVSLAQTERDRLQRLVESGLGKENDVAALTAAQASLASAQSARDAIFAALNASAVANLTIEQKAFLAQLKSNSPWTLPTQYLAVGREEPQWVGLRDDLLTSARRKAYLPMSKPLENRAIPKVEASHSPRRDQ